MEKSKEQYKEYLENEKNRIEAKFNEMQQDYEMIEEQLRMLQGSYQQVCKMIEDLYPKTQSEKDEEKR